jgi:hypothetical protein
LPEGSGGMEQSTNDEEKYSIILVAYEPNTQLSVKKSGNFKAVNVTSPPTWPERELMLKRGKSTNTTIKFPSTESPFSRRLKIRSRYIGFDKVTEGERHIAEVEDRKDAGV